MVELGNKHECLNCGTKFYDLGKSQLICPSCEGDQAELAKELGDKPKAKTKTRAKKKAKPKAKAKATKKAKTTAKKKKADGDEEVKDES
jgi:hypothetical protein